MHRSRRHNRNLDAEVVARDAIGDLVAEGFDPAVRFGDPPPSNTLVTRKIAATRILTTAAPAYLERRGRPAHPSDLSSHDCIEFRDPVTGRAFEREFRRGREVLPVETSGPLLVSDVEFFPDWPDEGFPLYALQPGRGRSAAKARAFLDLCRAATRGNGSQHQIHLLAV